MSKLSSFFKNAYENIKGISKGKKIALGVMLSGIIIALVYLVIVSSNPKYSVLFSNLEPTDVKSVTTKLDEKKVVWKASGSSISVPKDQVEKLRLELAPDLTNGSKGFELLDSTKFGATDEEMKVGYQRAIQGELERTIKGFPQIEDVRVHIVPSEDSVFVKDSTPASASVTLKLKAGQKLDDDQVRSIVALLCGAVKNLPKDKVSVVDERMTLLTKGIFDNEKNELSTSTDKQQELKNKVEKELEQKVYKVLEPAYKDVRVSVNADLNFDAIQNETLTYAPNGTVVSNHTVEDIQGGTITKPSQSPVDENMNNNIPNNTADNQTILHREVTNNYEISKTQINTIKAPGETKRVSTSVLLNGNLDEVTRNKIRNLVVSAIGYDEKRGDNISIEGLTFNNQAASDAQKALDDMKQAELAKKKQQLYVLIGLGALGFILLITVVVMLVKRKKKGSSVGALDVTLDEAALPEQTVSYKPIEFEKNDEKTHLENEIKKYASEKPEQVVDIIKSWMAEDER